MDIFDLTDFVELIVLGEEPSTPVTFVANENDDLGPCWLEE